MARLVGGLHVDDEQVEARLQFGQCHVALAFEVGVVPAGGPGDVADLHPGQHANAPHQVHGGDQSRIHTVYVTERRNLRLEALTPQPCLVCLAVEAGHHLA